jgi:thiol:disulfide interchange protein DsbC
MSTRAMTKFSLQLSPRKLAAAALAAVIAMAALAACLDARAAGAGAPLPADPAAIAMRRSLTQRYPNTSFGDIARSAVPGLWEVWMGANVAYVADEGRHFIFGHLYDMQTQTDLTAAKKEQLALQLEAARPKLSFPDLPLADAIKTVRGGGQRKMAVFSDPHCPYCRDLEKQLAKLDNVTVYTFLLPIDSLHPEAAAIARSIWCARDRAGAWKQFMAIGKAPPPARCDTPLGRTADLAEKAGINGTPFILFGNGDRAAGALDAASLERRLSRNQSREVK